MNPSQLFRLKRDWQTIHFRNMNFPILFLILVILTSTSVAYAEEYVVDIPFGAYNPELNTPAEVWYDPPQMFVTVGDTITLVL